MATKEEILKKGYITYENENIKVFWNPKICQHVGKCVRGNGRNRNMMKDLGAKAFSYGYACPVLMECS